LSQQYLKIQSVPQRKQHVTITAISWLAVFREIIAVCSENALKIWIGFLNKATVLPLSPTI
jgi:hypothetical protein